MSSRACFGGIELKSSCSPRARPLLRLMEHWNGRSLTRISAPPTRGELGSVSCSSARNCWAVGSPVNQVITPAEHFDGHSWRIIRLPGSFGAHRQYQAQAVSCRSLVSCWIVSSSSGRGNKPAALHLSGGAWRLVGMPTPQYADAVLTAIDCASRTDCWAVGVNVAGGPGGRVKELPFAEEWDGSSWRVAKVAGATGQIIYLSGVSCASAPFCVAVGSVGARSNSSPLVANSRPFG